MAQSSNRGVGAIWSLTLLAVSVGCSGERDGSIGRDDPNAANDMAGPTSNAGNSAGNVFGNADAASTVELPPLPDAGAMMGASTASDASLTEETACGMGTVSAELTPVNMLVMFDRSGSMEDDDKWSNATAALTSFFENPGAEGLRVALRFFPHDEPAEGCTEDGCDADACSQPLVSLGSLSAAPAPSDAHEEALVVAIEDSDPGNGGGGGTPIYAALDGALSWAQGHSAMFPDETTVVIFVTDGEPNGCDEDFDSISELASDALANAGTATYAIGLEGSSEEQMDQLAEAGGTTSGIFIDNSANAEQELLNALNMIRGATLSCDFPMPEPISSNMEIDPAKVNVTFTPGGGSASTLPQVAGESACASSSSWYYDDVAAPTRITLCPEACELVRADPDGELQVLLGCETVCGGLDVDCGGEPPPEVPPPIID